MRFSRTALVAALALVAFQPVAGSAQDLGQLIAAGRFDEAAALLASASPEQAEAGAQAMFDQAYSLGFQAGRYDYAIQGFATARELPGLSPEMDRSLAFWHGLSLFQQTAPQARPQNVASAQATLPRFQEAQALLTESGVYGSTVGVDLNGAMSALATFIEIQEAIIRRGY